MKKSKEEVKSRDNAPGKKRLKKAYYEKELNRLQIELVKVQQ
jgi:polyphosphate kinase 2 (PPK2 family)